MSGEDWLLEQALSHDPDVVMWTYYPESMNEAAARDRVRISIERAEKRILQRYVIWSNAEALGTCGISHLESSAPQIMYALLPTARGRGHATAAAIALADWAKGAGYAKVVLETVDGNAASERVAVKAGFTMVHSGLEDHRGAMAMIHTWERKFASD